MSVMTPTFNDLANNGAGPTVGAGPVRSDGAGGAPVHVIAAHEPLQNEPPVPQAREAPTPILPVAPAAQPEILKVALVGTAPSSRMLAPFGDPTWKIWACSPGNMNVLPRADIWFELHGNLHWPENAHYGMPYVDWLKRLTIPLFMQSTEYCPNATPFPYEEMTKEFGKDFFTSSFAWMMAYAIHSGAKEIALFGIDMASRDEYILQRPGFYFFKHVAEQRGIKVSAPNESDIMQPPGLYGFSEVRPFGRKVLAREKELRDRINGMIAERDKLNHNITYLQGALEDLDYIKSIWIGQS